MTKETIVCKFDSEIECTEYNCEYTCSELENLELDGEESCLLFKKEQTVLLKLLGVQKEIADYKRLLTETLDQAKEYEDKMEAKIEAANNTLKQARDFIEAIGDDKLSANHVLNLISTLEETLHIPRKEPQP